MIKGYKARRGICSVRAAVGDEEDLREVVLLGLDKYKIIGYSEFVVDSV